MDPGKLALNLARIIYFNLALRSVAWLIRRTPLLICYISLARWVKNCFLFFVLTRTVISPPQKIVHSPSETDKIKHSFNNQLNLRQIKVALAFVLEHNCHSVSNRQMRAEFFLEVGSLCLRWDYNACCGYSISYSPEFYVSVSCKLTTLTVIPLHYCLLKKNYKYSNSIQPFKIVQTKKKTKFIILYFVYNCIYLGNYSYSKLKLTNHKIF